MYPIYLSLLIIDKHFCSSKVHTVIGKFSKMHPKWKIGQVYCIDTR